jgi:hypothetical protein
LGLRSQRKELKDEDTATWLDGVLQGCVPPANQWAYLEPEDQKPVRLSVGVFLAFLALSTMIVIGLGGFVWWQWDSLIEARSL